MAAMDLWAKWNTIKCPILVLRGRQSDLLLSDTLTQMKENSAVRAVEFDDCGHTPQFVAGPKIDCVIEFFKSS